LKKLFILSKTRSCFSFFSLESAGRNQAIDPDN